jgi:PIN domain nuclease of toxin-antitoxin system
MKTIARLAVVTSVACLAACAGSRGVDKAFTDKKSAVQGNSHSVHAPPDVALRAVTGTLVQKGFAIEQVDAAMGLIRATRNLTDTKNPDTNYHVSATAYVSGASDGDKSLISLAASQQTVLYRKGHSWTMLPLLPIIPIPTGRKYETVVTGEGSILRGNFYAEFFAAVDQNLAASSEAPESAHPAQSHSTPQPLHALSAPGPEAIPYSSPAADKPADASSPPP